MIRRPKDEVNLGFSLRDTAMLRELDVARSPNIQTFISSDYEEEEDIEEERFCPSCSSLLSKVAPNIDKWLCRYCATIVDSWTYDLPLVTNKESNIRTPIEHRGRYRKANEDDELLYFRSWSPGHKQESSEEYDIVRSDNTGRVKTIRMKPGVSPFAYSIKEDLAGGEQV
jgi:hypothetical protein